jgi:hypothetical protein
MTGLCGLDLYTGAGEHACTYDTAPETCQLRRGPVLGAPFFGEDHGSPTSSTVPPLRRGQSRGASSELAITRSSDRLTRHSS